MWGRGRGRGHRTGSCSDGIAYSALFTRFFNLLVDVLVVRLCRRYQNLTKISRIYNALAPRPG